MNCLLLLTTVTCFLAPQPALVRTSLNLGNGGLSPEALKQSFEMMKNLTPDQLDMMLSQVENMKPSEKEQMKKMGVNPDLMKMTMKTLRNNPKIFEAWQKQMSSMSQAEMESAAKLAEQQMKNIDPAQYEQMTAEATRNLETLADMDAAGLPVTVGSPVPAGAQGTAKDPALIDAMFQTAKYTANLPSGQVDIKAFKLLPPIAALRGMNDDMDLSDAEINDVWMEQAGAPGVDRAGFERVWLAIDELYQDDLMVEARRTPKKTRGEDADEVEEEEA